MRKGALLAGVLLPSVLMAAACAPDRAPGTSDSGPTIVSLNPCIDAILVDVAAPGQVLALSHYSRDSGSSSISKDVAAHYGVTGGTAEEVIALAPDLVLVSSFLPQPTRQAFERAGLRVEAFGSPTTVAASIAQVREVAQVVGRKARGERLVRDMAQAAMPADNARPIATLLW
ncbi:MAG: ABC transporter substrate-binding protein, partial [Erythrobacter sp.]|nr:ABC transporter substrate-binding protein [Erythrobacter sp.]